MTIKTKIKKAVEDPLYLYNWARSKISSRFYLSSLEKQGKQLNLDTPKFLLSFDCDTVADISAAKRLFQKFSNFNIYPLIAAPADIIEEGLETFQELAAQGAVFINHGSKHHAAVNSNNEIYSTFTYENTPEQVWQQDIIDGHHRLKNYLGVSVKGFRTPHFGEFSSPSNLKKLYKLLIDLGYNYSSSTTPIHVRIARRSHKWSENKIIEFPVNGQIQQPSQIIDSWSFMQSGENRQQIKEILCALNSYINVFNAETKIFLNLYFDPAQLEQQKEICDSLIRFAPWAIKSFEELIESP